jgi:hypothetical protein
MNEEHRQLLDTIRDTINTQDERLETPEEIIEVLHYPEDRGDEEGNEDNEEIDLLIQAARSERQQATNPSSSSLQIKPIGYVTNALNSASRSDMFQFWAPAEETTLGIGSLVKHTTTIPTQVNTYGVIVDTVGNTLGLKDFGIHVYEQDAQPPLESILPAPSSRRPIVHYQARVIASTQKTQRPVLSGPVYAVTAQELAEVHNKNQGLWLDPQYLLLGFYEDSKGTFGIFGEERTRVLGPKQGHVILSGLPGAGKTSLFLTLIISLYAQLQRMEDENTNEEA